MRDTDKPRILNVAGRLKELGFHLMATKGTAEFFQQSGITVDTVQKVKEGRPHVLDHLKNQAIALVINTVGDQRSKEDSYVLRRATLINNIPYFTTISGAKAALLAIEAVRMRESRVKCLQDYYEEWENLRI